MSHCYVRHRRETGFTLIEILTVTAVLGLLVAILLPAVQASRAAARRVHCLNNLRQIGIGLHQHHAARNSFPHARDEQWWSWLAHTLPQLEEGKSYDLIDFSLPAWDTVQNQEVAAAVIPTFLCVADAGNDRVGSRPYFDDDYASLENESMACGGLDDFDLWIGDQNPYAEYAFTNYLGVSGTQAGFLGEEYRGRGMFPSSGDEFRLGAAISLSKVTDGTSKTLFVGERPVVRFAEHEYARNDLGWWATGHGWEPAPYGRADYVLDSMNGLQPGNAHGALIDNATHWWSHHSAGAQFLLVDGSARMMSYTTSPELFLAMSTRNGND